MKSSLTYYSSIWPWATEITQYFSQIMNTNDIVTGLMAIDSIPAVLRMDIRLDTAYMQYEKDIYTLMNFLSDLGGIFNAILFLCRGIINIFHENMVFARVLSSLFTI